MINYMQNNLKRVKHHPTVPSIIALSAQE